MAAPHEQQGFLASFRVAAEGVAAAAHGRNFRVQSAFAVCAVALGFLLRIAEGEWLAVVFCIALVLGAECLNTALEALVDLASPEIHPLAKRAKDCAAGAVLVFAVGALIVGIIVFAPKLVALMFGVTA